MASLNLSDIISAGNWTSTSPRCTLESLRTSPDWLDAWSRAFTESTIFAERSNQLLWSRYYHVLNLYLRSNHIVIKTTGRIKTFRSNCHKNWKNKNFLVSLWPKSNEQKLSGQNLKTFQVRLLHHLVSSKLCRDSGWDGETHLSSLIAGCWTF